MDSAHAGEHHGGGMKVMYVVWVWLLVLTIAEVLLAYFEVPIFFMLVLLIGMSLVKAWLIVAWFMHLKFERKSLVLTLIPAAIICIMLMNVFFSDSARLGSLGIFD